MKFVTCYWFCLFSIFHGRTQIITTELFLTKVINYEVLFAQCLDRPSIEQVLTEKLIATLIFGYNCKIINCTA